MCRIELFFNLFIIVTFATKSYSYVTVNSNEDVIVEAPAGSIRGLRADDGNYTMFMGIPFANVNRSNVFGEAIPQEPFDDVFDAFDDSAICPQIEEFNSTTIGSLDCLHLNVYVPDSASPQNLLPVMVYIYGGGFNFGFAGRFLYGPTYLVRHDVILVTINYRLGPYGFFCLNTPEVPGNAGLKDQVMALRWIQNNIESFGGDFNKVTLFGNSAGGISAGLHLISETEKLFSNIIMQSGPPYFAGIVSAPNPNAPLALAAALNFETDDINEALSFLAETDEHLVIEASSSFRPCVEEEFPGVERFLSELPLNSRYLKAPGTAIMLGFSSHEVLSFFPEDAGPVLWILWRIYLDNIFLVSDFDFDRNQSSQLSALVRRFYVGDERINRNVRQEVMNHMNDFLFVYPIIRNINPYLEAGVEKIYQYLFSYDGDRNFLKIKDNITTPGATHADELGYLFKSDFIPEEPSEADQLIIDRITTLWTNFAKYGDPTLETSSLLPVKWEAITKGSPYHYIDIDTEMTSHMRYAAQRMTFWDLFYKSYRQYQRGYIEEDEEVELEIESTTNAPVPDSATLVSFRPVTFSIVFLFNVVFTTHLN